MKTETKAFLTLLGFILAYSYFDSETSENWKVYHGDETMCKVWPENNTDYYVLKKCK